MIRLIFSDLRDHVATWIGAFVVAVACGYIGGWVASLFTTMGFSAEGLQRGLQNAATVILAFSLVAGVAVLISAANLTVSVQQRSYALWQLANVRPRFVSAVVLIQLTVVAVLGALCGTLLASATFAPLFPLVFSARIEIARAIPHAGAQLMPVVWLVVAGVFLGGGLKGARSAGMTPPLAVLREPEPKRMTMTWLRAVIFILLAVAASWLYVAMGEAAPVDALSFAPFMSILVVAALAAVAPLVFSRLLSFWTKLVPKRWNAWYLARHTARYGLSTSTSVETPIMVCFGLAAGLFSVVKVLTDYLQRQGVADINGLDSTTIILMLGGPVLLCAIGAAVSVVMSSRSRTRDIALLTASGARPSTLMTAAVCEAFIHSVTATLVGMGSVVISHALIANALGFALFDGITFGVGLVVSLVGFVLILVATLVPTAVALNRDTATALAPQ